MHQLGSQTTPCVTGTLPAPHSRFAIWVHSAYHVMLSQVHFLQTFQLGVELHPPPHLALTLPWHMHLLAILQHLMQRYMQVVAHNSVRDLLFGRKCSLCFRLRLKFFTIVPLIHRTMRTNCVLQSRILVLCFLLNVCWPSSAPSLIHPALLDACLANPPFHCLPKKKIGRQESFSVFLLGAMRLDVLDLQQQKAFLVSCAHQIIRRFESQNIISPLQSPHMMPLSATFAGVGSTTLLKSQKKTVNSDLLMVRCTSR